MTKVFTPEEIAVIRERHFGWEEATPSLLAAVFGTSIQHITAILKDGKATRESGTRSTGKPGAIKPPSPEASGPVGRDVSQ